MFFFYWKENGAQNYRSLPESEFANRNDNLRFNLILKNRPLKPFLVVYYHVQPNTLLIDKYFKMTCSAYVGTDGKLSFVIPAREGGKIHHWTVHLSRAGDYQNTSGEPGILRFKTGTHLI
ncbi:hypothetical protein ElyMa_001405000 [Elysia marginata]|uniref:Uncharacterized protein n=1 Tax=Elysia marginata TaxID=1093978 RepID=A0AAV4IT77_9GAST|nr:hypothetical protein ElyMa_001405000 [Elysia marginata]